MVIHETLETLSLHTPHQIDANEKTSIWIQENNLSPIIAVVKRLARWSNDDHEEETKGVLVIDHK